MSRNIAFTALKKLLILHRLEALKGDRAQEHSIGVNDQWRICFTWRAVGGANGLYAALCRTRTR
ncbi:MAG: hypothetical protein ACT4PZ_23130 [Panacagrimonas sp.]